jgi:Cu+-exporting ATPase
MTKDTQKAGKKLPSGETVTVTLPLVGMSCASCASTIEKALTAVEGISEAAVNFAAEKAKVTYDPHQPLKRPLQPLKEYPKQP